jgi:hypothetical protein
MGRYGPARAESSQRCDDAHGAALLAAAELGAALTGVSDEELRYVTEGHLVAFNSNYKTWYPAGVSIFGLNRAARRTHATGTSNGRIAMQVDGRR